MANEAPIYHQVRAWLNQVRAARAAAMAPAGTPAATGAAATKIPAYDRSAIHERSRKLLAGGVIR